MYVENVFLPHHYSIELLSKDPEKRCFFSYLLKRSLNCIINPPVQ